MQAVYSSLFWLFLSVSSIALFFVALLIWCATAVFDRRRVLLHRFSCFWASLYSWLNPVWRVKIFGREKIRSREAYVMIANHLSTLDILVLYRLFKHFKWVSKVENFKVPFIGWNMSLNRYIKLQRGSRESAARMLETCRETLAAGSSVLMFPEGTRSPDGKLQAFKRGAFELALTAHKSILPIVIEGTAAALPKRGFLLRGRHYIQVTVLEALPFESFRNLSVEALAERAHALYAERLGEPPLLFTPSGS